MNELISAARGVLENWEKGDLAAAVRALQGALEALPEKVTATPEQVAVAKDYTGWSDELRFDADAEISLADKGHWISGWQWIPRDDDPAQ
ncbi:hypothetical protein K2O51_30950 (plasmid) [Cupriavidus pinatubonensis]|uniref:hypothetical protein n=1 Tax=Cupriavidus pinatubonensis TaxID=248026 RepID=UPI001C734CAA|nr:hypothetical protein [Cupriavidus pinatubonensis]QYY33668.1 hypothetical protein K2O51_30950 [Cupriavidus pinatubonensis]